METLTMDEKFNQIIKITVSSLCSMENKYFDYRVAGRVKPIQREKQFCTELYHQLRLHNFPSYDITTDPNKKRHPIIEELCGPIDPDIIVHRMGQMGPEDNLAVIEVKASDGDLTNGINKDMKTINCMTTIKNGYHGGIIIVFGPLSQLIMKNLIERIKTQKSEKMARFCLILISDSKTSPKIIEM